MKETIIFALYWLLNAAILVFALIFAIDVWESKKRVLESVLLMAGGCLWHAIRGGYNYIFNYCENLEHNDRFLVTANKCIPPTDLDIIYAQVAIFVGLFVLIAEVFIRYNRE